MNKNSIFKSFIILVLTFIISMFIHIKYQCSLFFLIELVSIILFILFSIFKYKDRFNPIFFILYTSVLGILDVIFVALNIRNVNRHYDIEIYEKALLIIVVWIILFLFSYKITRVKKKMNNKKDKTINENTVKFILIINLIVYLFIIYKILSTISILGFNNAITNSAIFRYNNQGYLLSLLNLSGIIPICLIELKHKKTAVFSILFMIIIIFLTGRRGLIINSIIIPVAIYYNYKIRTITNKKMILVLILCSALILFIGNIRGQESDVESNSVVTKALTNLTLSTQLGENLPDTIYALDNNKVNYLGNKYIFNGILGLIPRSIWNDKPSLVDHSMIVSEEIYKIKTYGRPIGAYGYSYLCFSWVGVIITSILSGVFAKIVYQKMLNNFDFLSIFIYAISINYIINFIKPESIINLFLIVILGLLIKLFTYLTNK